MSRGGSSARDVRTSRLITASSPEIRSVRRSRVLNFQQVTMAYLAALTPAHWSIHHVDEAVDCLDFGTPADVAAITCHTPNAPHAYRVAGELRKRGVFVAFGGPHATLVPDEVQRHCDAVFVGEAEETWPRFLADFEAGHPAARYTCEHPPSLACAPASRQEFLQRPDHTAGALFATRGCPHACEFCTLVTMYRGSPRKRPVEAVAREYASFRGRVVIFWDDNITHDMEHAKELCRALTPHRKWWASQASVEAARDDEFLELAARSGCKQLFIGFESLSQASLDASGKRFNRVDRYAEDIARVHAHGIAVQAGIVFGFDCDTDTVFHDTVDVLEESGVQNATFNILTPFPGTPLFDRLEAEGRILTRDWNLYDGRAHVVFQPRNMSPEALLGGFRAATRRFYSGEGIWRRLSRSPVQLHWTLPLNLVYSAALRRERAATPDSTAPQSSTRTVASPAG